jgi:uncharacterized iron-regulated membrane protein
MWREKKERVLLGIALLSTASIGYLAWRVSSSSRRVDTTSLVTLARRLDDQSMIASQLGALQPLSTEAMLLHDGNSQVRFMLLPTGFEVVGT